MPELPEVETVRRALEGSVAGRTIASVRLSGLRLRSAIPRTLPERMRGRTFGAPRRHGKYLLLDLDRGLTLVSHLGMSGRWLFWPGRPPAPVPHLHVRIRLRGGGELWFQDPRRFGLLRLAATAALERDPSLRRLGRDPLADPPDPSRLHALARGARVAIKTFLMDQRRIAGIGNIYASEILFRAGVDPRRRAGALTGAEWAAVAGEIPAVLNEATERMGTTFSMYRTLWNEPGTYGDRLMVYDRAGEPCRRCGSPIRRLVQGQRSTFYCPTCQGRARRPGARVSGPGPARARMGSPGTPGAPRPRPASRAG